MSDLFGNHIVGFPMRRLIYLLFDYFPSGFRVGNRFLLHQFLIIAYVNPYLTNGFSHYYHLGESTFIFRGIRSDFQFLNKFLMKILLANRIAPDGTPRSAASHLGLFCLPMYKKDARLK